MRRVAAAIVVALALCGIAHADTEQIPGVTYWVSRAGGSTGADSSHTMTLAQACASATAGDTVRFTHAAMPGYRGQAISPARSGTFQNAIVFIGDPVYPSSIVIGGIDFGYLAASRDTCIRVSGFRILNTTTTSNASDGVGLIASHYIHLKNCVIDSLRCVNDYVLGKGSEHSRIDSCTFNIGGTGLHRLWFGSNDQAPAGCPQIGGQDWYSTNHADWDTLSNSSLNVNSQDYGPMLRWNFLEHFTCSRNHFTAIAGTDAVQGMWKEYGVRYSEFLDNYISLRNLNACPMDANACNECGMEYIRETSAFNNWQRDTTIKLGGTYQNTYLTASGTCGGVTYDNVYNACVFRDSCHTAQPTGTASCAGGQGTPSDHGGVAWQNGSRGCQFTNNLVVVQYGEAANFEAFSTAGTNYAFSLVEGNTFVSLESGKRASDQDWDDTSIFRNNIYYSTGNPAAVSFFTNDGVTSTTDFNMYWSTGGDSTKAVSWNSVVGLVGPTEVADGYNGQEVHSTFHDPKFVNVTTNALTFDAHLKTGSPAIGTGFGGRDIGAYQFGGVIQPPVDTLKIIYVAPEARGGSYTGGAGFPAAGDSTAPITLKRANEMANAGMTFVLLGGDYTADTEYRPSLCATGCVTLTAELGRGICPLSSGTGATPSKSVRFMSLWYYRAAILGTATATDTNSYRVGNITLARSFVHVAGVSGDTIIFRAQTWDGANCASTSTPASWCYRPVSDSLVYCKGVRLQMQAASNCYVRSCWFITPLRAGASGAAAAQNYLLGGAAKLRGEQPECNGVWISDTYFRVRVNYNQQAISIGGQSLSIYFNRCQFYGDMIPSGVTPISTYTDTCVFLALRNAHDVFLTDCRFRINSGAAETNPIYGVADSLSIYAIAMSNGFNHGTFTRDTLDLGFRAPLGSATTGVGIQIGTLGGFGSPSANQPIENVTFTGCLVRGDYLWRQSAKLANSSFRQSVLGNKRHSAMYVGSNCDTLSFDQCTFYSDSLAAGTQRYRSQPAFLSAVPLNSQPMVVTRCLFYRAKVSIDAPTVGYPSGAIVQYGCPPSDATKFRADNNLFYSVAAADDSTRASSSQAAALYVGGWASSGAIRDSVALANTPVVPYLPYHTGSEARSLFGSPAFADAGVDSTFSGALSCQYASWNAYRPATTDSAVGGVQDNAPTPGVCTSLDTTASAPTTITVSFVGAANDSVLNRGTPSGYEIWYGTNASVTGGTYVIHYTAGVAPGSTVTAQLGVGSEAALTNNTVYFFFVRVRSRCGALGPPSVVQCGVTRASSGVSGFSLCRDL